MVIQISRYAGKNCLLSSNCRLKYVDFLSGNGDTVDLAELYPRSNPDCRNDANKKTGITGIFPNAMAASPTLMPVLFPLLKIIAATKRPCNLPQPSFHPSTDTSADKRNGRPSKLAKYDALNPP